MSAYVVAEGLGIRLEDEDTGQVNGLVNDALQMEVATPVIAAAVMQRIASRDEASAGRDGANGAIVEEGRTSRVGTFVRSEYATQR